MSEAGMTTGRKSSEGQQPAGRKPRGSGSAASIVVRVENGTPVARVDDGRSLFPEKIEISESAEERRRTGRYLAVCLTLVMLFIACYHILMRQMPVLVGILAPAIIMILYVIWLLYFAKKRKRTEIVLV